MKNKEIYEVSRDEYAGFLDQIKPECRDVQKIEEDDTITLNVYSKKTNKLLCSRVAPQNAYERYYVFNMPDNDECRAAKPVQKIVLETKEEVQAFLDIINKLSHEGKKND